MGQRNNGKLESIWTDKHENTAYKNLWNGAKAKQRKIYSNDLGFHFTKPEKVGQMKPQINNIKGTIKSRTEIHDIDKKDSWERGEKNQWNQKPVLWKYQ